MSQGDVDMTGDGILCMVELGVDQRPIWMMHRYLDDAFVSVL